MNKRLITIFAIIISSIFLFIFFGNRVNLPRGETEKETILINNGQVVDESADGNSVNNGEHLNNVTNEFLSKEASNNSNAMKKEIFVTDGVRHSVPIDEILGGGPPKDGIPPIDNPKYISASIASEFLAQEEPGIAFSEGNTDRFYPFQILVFHEIVNDTVNGKRVLVSYCPLCFTGIVFDPLVKGKRVEFGTSGKLWNSNLVMYDRATDSLWSQVLGEAILGEMTGTKLDILSSDIAKFGDWKALHPNGEVLSKDTGSIRTYGRDPYGDYYTTPGLYFPVNNKDSRLKDKDFVLGIVINEKSKAYHTEAIKKAGEVNDEFAGKSLLIKHDDKLDVVNIFEKKPDGTLSKINPIAGFWFSWVSVYPQTELYK